jgi:hypothetical protein
MSSMCVAMDSAKIRISMTDSQQGSYVRRTVSVSETTHRVAAGLRAILSSDHGICSYICLHA